MAEAEAAVVYSSLVDAKCGFFSMFSERCCLRVPMDQHQQSAWGDRFFVLTDAELLWFDKRKDFENNFPPEKRCHLSELNQVSLLDGNGKFPGQVELVYQQEIKWEMRFKTKDEATAWVTFHTFVPMTGK